MANEVEWQLGDFVKTITMSSDINYGYVVEIDDSSTCYRIAWIGRSDFKGAPWVPIYCIHKPNDLEIALYRGKDDRRTEGWTSSGIYLH